jgi:hypothetical protein
MCKFNKEKIMSHKESQFFVKNTIKAIPKVVIQKDNSACNALTSGCQDTVSYCLLLAKSDREPGRAQNI